VDGVSSDGVTLSRVTLHNIGRDSTLWRLHGEAMRGRQSREKWEDAAHGVLVKLGYVQPSRVAECIRVPWPRPIFGVGASLC
jgi:hypothetical protein